MMPMTSTISAGNNLIGIHVYDPIAKLEHTFECSKELLASRVGYFADQMGHDRLTVENCDLCLFDWLIRWAHGDEPTFARTNVIRILMLASFLRVEPLVRKCLDFCVEDKVGMSSLSEGELLQIAPHMGVSHLEGLEGLKSCKVLGRLYYELLKAWTNGSDPLRGNFCDLARLYRCAKCSVLVHRDKPHSPDGCEHEEHRSWSIQDYVAGLHKDIKSWQKVYWLLWAQVHFFLCSSCRVYVPAQDMSWDGQIDATHPLGSFACCGRTVYNRDFLHNVENYVSKSLSPDDICSVVHNTLDTYLFRVTGKSRQENEVNAEKCDTYLPLIDMSNLWKTDQLSVAREPIISHSQQLLEDIQDNNDNICCEDPSDDEDVCLQQQRINKWFDNNGDMPQYCNQAVIEEDKCQTPLEVMFKKCLLGPYGDSPDLIDEVALKNMEAYKKMETLSGTPLIADDKWKPKKTRDERNFLEESESSNGSEGTPIMAKGEGDSDESSSNASAIMTRGDLCSIEDRSVNSSNSGSIVKSEHVHNTEYDVSSRPSDGSERHVSNLGSDESTSYMSEYEEEMEEEEEEEEVDEGTNEESTVDHRRHLHIKYLKSVANVEGSGQNEQYPDWKPYLSHAQNQTNQNECELYKNEQIIHYLTTRIYNLPKVKHDISTLTSGEIAERSQWLTHIDPWVGDYSQTKEEFRQHNAFDNRKKYCVDYEETDIPNDITYLYEQNE